MFSKRTFKESIGWIILILGIVLYIIGYGFLDINSIASHVIINLADLAIIGVVVGYLSSVAQWSGVFKREIQNIVFGKEFIGKRTDVEEMWNNVTKQLLKNKFSEIHKELLSALKATMPNDESVSYYEDHDSDIQIQWIDREKGLVKSTEVINFTLVAESIKEIKLPIKTMTTTRNIGECRVSDPKIYVDNVKPQLKINTPHVTSNEIIHSATVSLQGKKQYQVSYTREKTYNINEDYYIGLKSQFLVRNLTVSLQLPDGIEAIFIERGTNIGFQTVKNSKECIKMKLKGVIFPKQGYIFALKAVNQPT